MARSPFECWDSNDICDFRSGMQPFGAIPDLPLYFNISSSNGLVDGSVCDLCAPRGSFSHSISSSSTVVQSPRSLVSVFATILSAPLRNDSFILIFLCLFSSFLNKSDTEKWSRSDGSNLLHVPTHNFLFTTARLKRNVFLYSWRCASACLMSINLNIPKNIDKNGRREEIKRGRFAIAY